jgi:hypothetical protein
MVRSSLAGAFGGLGARLTGDKFANGFLTGAFAHLWNAEGVGRPFADAARMAIDWAFGTGPAVYGFGPGTAQVQQLMGAPGVVAAREYFYAKNQDMLARGDLPNLRAVTNWRASFGLAEFAEASWPFNATRHFVGSYRVDILPINEGSSIQFSLTNVSSFQSFAYGAGPAYERATFGPGGNLRQNYHWTETVRRY